MALRVALNDRVIELGYCGRVCQPLSECVHSCLLVFSQKLSHYSKSRRSSLVALKYYLSS